MEKMNIYQKIQAVSNHIRNIEKNTTVGKGNYAYKATSDLDVTLAIKDAETKFGLVSIPYNQELVSSEVIKTLKKDGEEGLLFVENIKMTLRIVDLDDTSSFIDVVTYAKGLDTADKGFGKASTYARKYALLNAYKIPTGEDPDADQSVQTKTPKTPDDKRIAIAAYLDQNLETRTKLLEHFGVAELHQLTDAQINTIHKTYNQKGLI